MKKLKVTFLILMISFISIVLNPSIYGYGVNDLDNLNNQSDKATSVLSQSINNGSILDMLQSSSDDVSTISNEDYGIMPIAGSRVVSNESQLRQALADKVSEIIISTSIRCNNPLTVDYEVLIRPSSQNNAISYNGGASNIAFFNVKRGGNLKLTSIVSYTDNDTAYRNLTNVNIESGGKLTLYENSIIDTGLGNTGIKINSGAECISHSCHVVFAKVGILVCGTGKLTFQNTNAGAENGRTSEFWSNTTCVLFQSDCTSTCNFDKGNIIVRDNTNGIEVASNNATVNVSAGDYRNNSGDAFITKNGKVNISGGSIHNNGNGIRQGGATLNITGGSIYSNRVGIYTDPNYTGKMTISNSTNINSNTQYAINHSQNADNTCVIHGGSISGNVYLGKDNNYVNTDTSYPKFTVLPSKYYFKRRLVKTSSNSYANTEINNVTLVPSGDWYKFVNPDEDQYIVLWEGCVIRVLYKDKNGTVLDTRTISGDSGDPYHTEELEMEGFNLIESPSETEGVLSDRYKELTYVYELKKSSVDIQKTLGETFNTEKRNLEGVKFKAKALSFPEKVALTNPSQEYISSATDANGKCTIEGLPYGQYEITEVERPDYVFGNGLFVDGGEKVNSFTLNVNEEKTYSYNIENIPKRIQIKVFKEDSETNTTTQGDANLEGAEYSIYPTADCKESEKIETLKIQKQDDGTYSATSQEYLIGTYYAKETKAPEGYNKDEDVHTIEVDPSSQDSELELVEITYKDEVIKNDIEIYKYLKATDSTEKLPLEGVEFTATLNSNPSVEFKATTDAKGYCKLEDLPYGTYTLKETIVPDLAYDGNFTVGEDGRVTKTITHEIKVDKRSKEVYVYDDIVNVAKRMKIKVVKEDAQTVTTTQGEAHLEGAEYTVYKDKECREALETVTITKQGDGTYSATTSKEFLTGTYYVKETKAPIGYNLDKEVHEVTQNPVSQSSEVVTVPVTSKETVKKNNINITKYIEETDSTDKQLLAGAEFTAQLITDESPDSDKVYKSRDLGNGQYVIENLPYGTYRIWESKVPDSAYNGEFIVGDSSDRVQEFEQFVQLDSSESEAYSFPNVVDVSKRMKITVVKEDAQTVTTTQGEAHLEGAEYTVYKDKACSEALETITTVKQADGTYSATTEKEFSTGTYYVKETKAPTGYNIDKEVYEVKQNPGEQSDEVVTLSTTSKENVKRNNIEITKYLEGTDSTDKQLLAGAEFTAQLVTTTSPDSEKVYKSKDLGNGKYVIENLPYGTYKVWESKVPDSAYNGEFTVGDGTNRVKEFEQFIQLDSSESTAYSFPNIVDVSKRIKIKVVEEDKETKNVPQGDGILEGAEYTIYKDESCTEELETVTIEKQEDGTYSATSKKEFLTGTYYVKETKPSEGYNIDENVYTVTLDESTQEEEVEIVPQLSQESVIRNDIEIYKYLGSTASSEKRFLEGVEFTATLNSDTSLVFKATTDENGYCKLENMPYGTYTITETIVPDLAYNGEFTVGEDDTRVKTITKKIEVDKKDKVLYVYDDVTNVPKRMKIQIVKEDTQTGTTTQGEAHLEGAEYTIYKDEECTEPLETVTIEKQEDGTYSATTENEFLTGTYYVKETKPSEGYNIDEKVHEVTQNPAEQDDEVVVVSEKSQGNVKRNDIDITKYLEETASTPKQLLEGVEFTAQLAAGEGPDKDKLYKSREYEKGHYIIEDLPYGTYRIWESKIPDSAYNGEFMVGDNTDRVREFEQFVQLDSSESEVYEYPNIVNIAKRIKIQIVKEDEETGTDPQGDSHLEGSKYTIYKDEECTEPLETVAIEKQEDGTYSATTENEFLTGTYYVKETEPSKGYNPDETVYEITQSPSEQEDEVDIVSKTLKSSVKRNNIEMTKYLEATASTPKQTLEGAEFTAQLVATDTPDSEKLYKSKDLGDGKYIIEDLPYGTYKVWESKVPDVSYDGVFTVGESTQRVQEFTEFVEFDSSERQSYTFGDITDIAEKMQIKVRKIDADQLRPGDYVPNDSVLYGAEYTLYRDEACTDPIETITILDQKDEEGYYYGLSDWYLVGTYYVKETKAPEGYLIDEEVYKVEQNPAEQTEEHSNHFIISKDEAIRGVIRVIKYNNSSTSSTKNPATGAVLRLTLDSNPEVYYEATVDENGFLEFVDERYRDKFYPFTIPYGEYTITEVKASDSGAHIFMNPIATEIKVKDQIRRYIIDEEYVKMRLTIKSFDGETEKPIPGATFRIWNVEANNWYREMVYPSGEYISEFTTNELGQLTINRHIEAGDYIIYESKAPEGYAIDGKGYEFTLGVADNGDVVAIHDGNEETLESATIKYDNIPTKMYNYTAKIDNMPQKAKIRIHNEGEVLSAVKQDTDKETSLEVTTPLYEKQGLAGIKYRLTAAEDIVTSDGTVKMAKGESIEVITGEDGTVETDDLYLGTYILEQIETLPGYMLNTEPETIVLDYRTNGVDDKGNVIAPNEYVVEVDHTSQRIPYVLDFDKTYGDSEYNNVSGEIKDKVRFGLYAEQDIKAYGSESVLIKAGTLLEVIAVKDGKAKATADIPLGYYYIQELETDIPFEIDRTKYSFRFNPSERSNVQVIQINDGNAIDNPSKTGELNLLKITEKVYEEHKEEIDKLVKANDKEALDKLAKEYGLEGAKYQVFFKEGDEYKALQVKNKETGEYEDVVFTTGENGVDIQKLPYGTFYLKETEAPEKHAVNPNYIEIKISEKSSVYVVSDEKLKGKVLVKHVDEDTGKEIFPTEVYEGEVDSEYTIEDRLKDINDGYGAGFDIYEFKEENIPDNKNGVYKEEDQVIVYSYTRLKGKLLISKKDDKTGVGLPGCVFTIVDKVTGEVLVENAETDENGEFYMEKAPYGVYIFTEVKAPEGYVVDERCVGVELEIKSEETTVEVTNKLEVEIPDTGDVAVYVFIAIFIVSAVGIIYTIRKRRFAK